MKIELYFDNPTRKSNVGLSRKNRQLLLYHASNIKEMTVAGITKYFDTLKAKTSSKYFITNMLCKYLVEAGVITSADKKVICDCYKYEYVPDIPEVNIDSLLQKVKTITDYKSRDIAIVSESYYNFRRTSEIISLTEEDYMPKYSLNMQEYNCIIQEYKKNKPISKQLYINKNKTVIKKSQIEYLYQRLSNAVGQKVTPDKVRSFSIKRLIEEKGLLYTNKVLGHSNIEITKKYGG